MLQKCYILLGYKCQTNIYLFLPSLLQRNIDLFYTHIDIIALMIYFRVDMDFLWDLVY